MDEELIRQVNEDYQRGKVSIQDIARIRRLTVPEVLTAIGETGVMNVTFGGDLIDATEAGPNATMNYGQEVSVPFTTD